MLNNAKPTNLARAFELTVEQDPHASALVVDERSWTRGELAELAEKAVGTLLASGVKTGDRIVAHYDTTPEDVAFALGAARLGATLLPIPKRMGVREINFLLERSNAALFAHAGDVPPEGIVPPRSAAVLATTRVVAGNRVSMEVAATDDEHIALIGVTSGSTGQPKGVMHGWSGVAWAAERMRAIVDVRPGESVLVTGAGAGAPGFTFFTYLGMAHGITMVRSSHWDPKRVLQLALANRCVWSTMVTTMLQMFLDVRLEAIGDRRLESMRGVTVGGSFMSPYLITRAREELGMEVLRMYAMAECMSHSSMLMTDSEEDRNTFDGRPGPGAELAIFNDGGQHLAAGEVGEIGMRGPSLLKGYLADPEGKGKLMTRDGFLLSGDLGKIDAKGYVKVVGRKKEMINRGGFKIDPSEVEELIRHHSSVAKVVVVSYPDRVFGERACAVIEARSGQSMDFNSMIDFLRTAGLSKEKFPERLECWTALPLSPDGKILRAVVQADVRAKID